MAKIYGFLNRLNILHSDLSKHLGRSANTLIKCSRGEQKLLVSPWELFEAFESIGITNLDEVRNFAFVLKEDYEKSVEKKLIVKKTKQA